MPRKPPGLGLAEVGQVGAAEVAELGVAGGVEEDVGRLDVAVDDAALVRGAQRGEQIERQPPAGRRRQRPRAPRAARRASRPVISSNTNSPERRLRVVQRDDVGVAQPPGGLGLAREAQIGLALRIAVAPPPSGEQLERDRRPEQRVDRLVDARRWRPRPAAVGPGSAGSARAPARASRRRRVAGGRGLGVLQRGDLLGAARQRRIVPAQPGRRPRRRRRGTRAPAGGRRARASAAVRRADVRAAACRCRAASLVSAETREQPPERQPRAPRLVAAALRDQALVDEARLAQLAGAGRARAPRRAAPRRGRYSAAARAPVAARARRRARPRTGARAPRRRRRRRPARRPRWRRRRSRPRAPGRLASSASRTASAAVAHLERQRQRVGEPPDPLVELDRAPQLAALGRDPRRLDVGAVRDQVLDDVAGMVDGPQRGLFRGIVLGNGHRG